MRLTLPFLHELLHIGKNVIFLSCSCYNVRLFKGRHLLRLYLGITACYGYHRLRTLFLHSSYILA